MFLTSLVSSVANWATSVFGGKYPDGKMYESVGIRAQHEWLN